MGEAGTGTNWFELGKQSMGSKLGKSRVGEKSGWDQVQEVLSKKANVMAAETKAIEKEKKTARNDAAQKISQAFVDMGPSLKSLAQVSYTQAQNEIEALRNEMFAAIDADDAKAQADVMIRLNEIKSRHAADGEGLNTLVDSWESDSVSAEAMTADNLRVMENFASNKTKRVIYTDDQPPVMKYQWDTDIPIIDERTGEQKVDENGNPVFKMEEFSSEELQDMIITKETENGVKMLDYGQELKQAFQKDDMPDDATIKSKIEKIIPRDRNQIRDWLHGNPAEQDGLDVHGYLTDLMANELGTFEKLGIDLTDPQYAEWDVPGSEPGIQADEIPHEFKTKLIDGVMNVEDLEISHSVMTEIYAKHLQYDAMGKENKEYRSKNETSILGSNADATIEAKAKRTETLTNLQSLGDSTSAIFKEISGLSPDAIAKHLGFDSINSQIFNDQTGELESISTYIANATKKKAGEGGIGGKYNKKPA